jgi:hypothetical protein
MTNLQADISAAYQVEFTQEQCQLRAVFAFCKLRYLHRRGLIEDSRLATAYKNAQEAIGNKGAI